MTKPFLTRQIRFFLTRPQPCPYLPGRSERKVFTHLDPLEGPDVNAILCEAGFRRSQNIVYRPACETCSECRSVRIRAQELSFSRSQKRVWKRNTDIASRDCAAEATQEQFDLLNRYLDKRHADGGMVGMRFGDYESMMGEGSAHVVITEYRERLSGELVACAINDLLPDGRSMVYSFFDPEAAHRGLGTYMILHQSRLVANEHLPHVYLGYWIAGSPKMAYKRKFAPLEVLGPEGWQALE